MSNMELDHHGLQEVANAMRNESGSLGSAHKRKRESESNIDTRRGSKRVSPNMTLKSEHQSSVQALQNFTTLQQNHLEAHNGSADHASSVALAGIYPQMTIPQPTEVSFAAQSNDNDRNQETSFLESNHQNQDSYMERQNPSGDRGSASKPAVGSEEWHKVRKDNHKEVERRRRETINEGINELAKIVPGCEKNKGSILQRAVQFITELKENETQNIEKWTLEKLLTEQAIAELSASNDKLKTECDRAWREVETWKKTCQSAGLAPKKEDGLNAGDV